MTRAGFSTDWSQSISYWPDMFKTLGMTGKPNLSFLEIGCFEGRTTKWLLEHVLTDPTSALTVIDTFQGSAEFGPLGINGNSFDRFCKNLEPWLEKPAQLMVEQGRSQDILRDSHYWPEMDFIYVDGSHMAADVLSDAVLSWPLLKSGGAMCFDDYRWGTGGPDWARPGPAIEAFVSCYAPQLKAGPQGHDQFVVIKQ